jgi:hypothetical protein
MFFKSLPASINFNSFVSITSPSTYSVILPKLFANGNLESGFIDRLFFTTLITKNDKLTYGEIDPKITEIYEAAINNILSYKRQSELPHEHKKQFEICFTESASKLLFKYTQELIDRKSSAPPMIKEYCAKMQISIQKLCIQVFMMRHASESTFASKLTEADVKLAIEFNEFYFLNFQKIIEDNFKQKEKKSPYKCDKCGCKIKIGDFYYINLEHVEKFEEEDEIEVIVSTIQKILCAKCSGNKFSELMAKPSQDEQNVKESEREVK